MHVEQNFRFWIKNRYVEEMSSLVRFNYWFDLEELQRVNQVHYWILLQTASMTWDVCLDVVCGVSSNHRWAEIFPLAWPLLRHPVEEKEDEDKDGNSDVDKKRKKVRWEGGQEVKQEQCRDNNNDNNMISNKEKVEMKMSMRVTQNMQMGSVKELVWWGSQRIEALF